MGALSRRWRAFSAAGAPRFVVQWLRAGVPIDFVAPPPPWRPRNPSMPARDIAFIDDEVQRLQDVGAIRPVSNAWLAATSAAVHPIRVVRQRKPRMIVAMWRMTPFVREERFKMDTIETARTLTRPRDWLLSMDIKSGYHHVLMAPQAQPYLCFRWRSQAFSFRVLPFGLRSAPRVFTKILRVLVRRWRALGIRTVHYIDDFLFIASSKAEALWIRKIVEADLQKFGVCRAPEKGAWQPTQALTFLGLTFDTRRGRLSVPPEKTAGIRQAVLSLLAAAHRGRVPVRLMASVAGKVVAASPALRSARMLTRSLLAVIDSRRTWASHRYLPRAVLSDLKRLLNVLPAEAAVGRPLWDDGPDAVLTIATDASDDAWGAVVQGHAVSAHFDRSLASTHINDKELTAVLFALQSSLTELAVDRARRQAKAIDGARQLALAPRSRYTVRLLCDNQTAVAYLRNGGGRIPRLTALARHIWQWTVEHDVDLLVRWVPSLANPADAPSRDRPLDSLPDPDDWQLAPALARQVHQRFGPHDFDWFATAQNRQCPRFAAARYHPRAALIDAFAHDWSQHSTNGWVNPPFRLIGEALRHLILCRARATFIIPHWDAAPWWPKLWRVARASWQIPPGVLDTFRPVWLGNAASPGPPPWAVWAVALDGAAW